MLNFLGHIEAARGGRFTYRLAGEVHVAPDPVDLHFQEVLASLLAHGFPGFPRGISVRQAASLFGRWSAHYDLPDFRSAQRLAYVVDHYGEALTYDLLHFASTDLGQLWRGRRWRTLLDLIDRLPGHSWYATAVADDPDHARMMAESIIAREAEDDDEAPSPSPSLATWTPEVAALTRLTDEVRHLAYVTIAVNAQKPPQPPNPLPTPTSALEGQLKSARYALRKQRHEELVARMLPHKRSASD